MRNLNVHYFKNNKSLASYLSELCVFFNIDKNTIEVKDDMAILEGKNNVMVFTKNEELMLELAENCNCLLLHYIPEVKLISKLMDCSTNFTFVPKTSKIKKA